MSRPTESISGKFFMPMNTGSEASKKRFANSREVSASRSRDRFFSILPKLILTQTALWNKDFSFVPFISKLVEEIPVKGFARIAAPVAASLALACSPTQAKEVNGILAEDSNRPAATAPAELTPPAESQKPANPEVKTAPCHLLPEQYCNGDPVIIAGRNIVTSIRFKAPPGTPITSLFPAKVTTVLGKEAEGGKKKVVPQTGLRPIDGTIPPLLIFGDLTDQLVDTNDKGVNEGDPVAKVGPTGEIFVTWSGYNPANRKTVSAQEIIELFKRFFPEVMQKQPVEVPLVSAGGGWNVAEPKFPTGKP